MNCNHKIEENTIQKRAYKPQEISVMLDMPIKSVYNMLEITTDFIVHRTGKKGIRVHKKSFDEWWNSKRQE